MPGGAGAARRCSLQGRHRAADAGADREHRRVDSDGDDPVPLVTLSRVASGALRLVSWRLHKTLLYGPIESTPIDIGVKP
jgi:hypothetical protein